MNRFSALVILGLAMLTVLRGATEATCGGGCVVTSQCISYGGPNCRCTWFTCQCYGTCAGLKGLRNNTTPLKAAAVI
ncbi:hypothetical protein BV898_02916 [Hypsibius exemplaris]|uniref:Uncharacterized protein n=1 Tax=Hypsibius exemplaris TaxID=2072580 RepID=A0A1W0X6R0_HYPEX|nr:hypothetical protein BV898_02916 [Hypsibius exemplaris]